eukprot:m.437959 g.437959  ORF g.437959 m.437959 type:complete len:50 (-) comp18179_c0_seq1:2364-2513(-)
MGVIEGASLVSIKRGVYSEVEQGSKSPLSLEMYLSEYPKHALVGQPLST